MGFHNKLNLRMLAFAFGDVNFEINISTIHPIEALCWLEVSKDIKIILDFLFQAGYEN